MPAQWPGRSSAFRREDAARHHASQVQRLARPAVPAPTGPGGPSLYEHVLRQAIASQHGLIPSSRLELRACEGCGKAYLLTGVWLPVSDEGSIACPRCGTEAVSWDGAHAYVAYWQRQGELPERAAAARAGWTARTAVRTKR